MDSKIPKNIYSNIGFLYLLKANIYFILIKISSNWGSILYCKTVICYFKNNHKSKEGGHLKFIFYRVRICLKSKSLHEAFICITELNFH